MYFYYVYNGKIIGNKISANNPGITAGLYGMYTTYLEAALVANNEIYLNSSASITIGLRIDGGPRAVDYLHNTVLITGNGGPNVNAVYWYVYNSASYDATLKNNIFVVNTTVSSYAIYLAGTYSPTLYPALYRIDYNHYYSSGNLGYVIEQPRADLAAWKAAVTMDKNSVSFPISFVSNNQLEPTDYTGLLCERFPSVTTDIRNNNRKTFTAMGCYDGVTLTNNASLLEIQGINENAVQGDRDQLSVVFSNTGATSITAVEIEW
jgi:hypothetical protein